jgi:Ca2+-binding RTX toxin-like protein
MTATTPSPAAKGRRTSFDYGGGGSFVVNLTTGTASSPDGVETFRGIENAVGSHGNDTLIGNAAKNWLDGWRGDDHIEGRAGGDTLLGGDGTDFLDGGGGFDSCRFGKTLLNCEEELPLRSPH